MLRRALKAENIKLKHSPIWLAFIIIPLISAIMGSFNYYGNREILTSQWYSLWTQHTIFYCYLCFPALVGVYCSTICRLEHINNNWKSVLAEPIPLRTIYLAKLLTTMKMVLGTQIFIGILFWISGKVLGFSVTLPKELISWLVLGTVAGGVMVAFQLGISLCIRSFAVPIGIALIGGIAGLAARAAGVGLLFPYSLFAIGMCANSPETQLECPIFIFMGICLGFIGGFGMIGIKRMKKGMA